MLSKIGELMGAERTGLGQLLYPRFVDLGLEYREIRHLKAQFSLLLPILQYRVGQIILSSILIELGEFKHGCADFRVLSELVVIHDRKDKIVCEIINEYKLGLIPRRVVSGKCS